MTFSLPKTYPETAYLGSDLRKHQEESEKVRNVKGRQPVLESLVNS